MRNILSSCLEGRRHNKGWRGFAADLSKSWRSCASRIGAAYSRVIRQNSAILCVALAACGGGGSTQPAMPITPCQPPRIQLFGDSVQYAQGDRLQRYMDARFGAGKVVVTNLGLSGSMAAEMDAAKVEPGAVVVVNYGINDWKRGATADDYKAALRRTGAAVFETPSPPWDGYAYAMREVAATAGKPLIDVSAFVRALPDWGKHVPDGVHPDEWLLDQIVSQKVGPEMATLVAASVCS